MFKHVCTTEGKPKLSCGDGGVEEDQKKGDINANDDELGGSPDGVSSDDHSNESSRV